MRRRWMGGESLLPRRARGVSTSLVPTACLQHAVVGDGIWRRRVWSSTKYLDKSVRRVLAVHVSDLKHGKPCLHLQRAEGKQSEARGVGRYDCAPRLVRAGRKVGQWTCGCNLRRTPRSRRS